ncbi:MAG: bacillithiol biosynthesis cysteine-adding enzyme BshC [Gemmatimonadaceae bacterium]|nr:bacillithiol biosynthesis cysteine-adding enzyme BshC [Gemmatimonadaceae bacterium]
MTAQLPRVIAESLGGSPLVRAGIAGRLTEWYPRRPCSPDEWRDRATAVRGSAAGTGWLDAMAPAFGATGAAHERLVRVAQGGGVVVTTGQQPGLFGGPLYTLSKALSALELADAIERATGIPAAPVFWAATDDADFAEATFTWLRQDGGAVRVAHAQSASEGIPMAEVPLEGIDGAMRELLRASGSAADASVIAAVRKAYRHGTTIGGAYLELMRHVLEPLGMGVIDASHPSLLARERPVLEAALREAAQVERALVERERALRAHGYEPQVATVDGLSLVFSRDGQGRKARVPVAQGAAMADGSPTPLGPNVLLRPVVERAVLPTVAYVAGPGELAYFAQVSAVAAALDVALPLGVPRWSGTVLEPQIEATLRAREIGWRELETEHAVERRLAVSSLPIDLMHALDDLRRTAQERAEVFKGRLEAAGSPIDPRIVDGTTRGMTWRVDRLERRLVAAAKKREHRALHEIATARGALFPAGKRQERVLNFVPLLATWGSALLDAMRASARRHAEALVSGADLPSDS